MTLVIFDQAKPKFDNFSFIASQVFRLANVTIRKTSNNDFGSLTFL